jgi:hypothetical protein
MSNKSKALIQAKQKHFDYLKKNNAITDAKNGDLSLGAMKTLDILLQVYQEREEAKLLIELAFLRKKLGLEKNNDYVDRIKTYLLELKLPFELRDFKEHETGKEIAFSLTSFLNDIKSYKDTQHLVEINISKDFLDYMIDRAGYTVIDLTLSKKFKTKYGYKIYEMYSRYYGRPSRAGRNTGYINKSMEELNDKFGTNHKFVSKMQRSIDRGITEIFKLTGEEIFCYYEKSIKKFVFSWARPILSTPGVCKIPQTRVDEVVDWILDHTKYPIENVETYSKKIKNMILIDEYDDLESKYRGMLMFKYGYSIEEIDRMKMYDGKYKNFRKKEIQ